MQNYQQQAYFEITLRYGAIIFNPTFGSNLSSIALQRIMVKIERQAVLY